MSPSTALGEYLRARRDVLRPEDVGVRSGGRRRVPGLRREEVAKLAGISAQYYLRLEQGRDRNPSPQVLDALARALRLDEDGAEHLRSLSQPGVTRRRRAAGQGPPRGIVQLISGWPTTPAFVHDRITEVLAANRLARALSPLFTPGVNHTRALFLDPAARGIYADWSGVARGAVARLRVLVSHDVADPRLVEFVHAPSDESEAFRALWVRHDVQTTRPPRSRFEHPLVGRIELQPERLAIVEADGQLLVILHPAPGSVSERRLARLAAAIGEPR